MFYTYFCPNCNKEFEHVHGMTEEPELFCECNTQLRMKVTGGCGIIYKGNGWPRKGSGLVGSVKHEYVHDLVAAVSADGSPIEKPGEEE